MLPEDLQILASLNLALSSVGSREDLFNVLMQHLKPVFGFDMAIIGMVEPDTNRDASRFAQPISLVSTPLGERRAHIFAHLLLPEMLQTDLIQRFMRRKIKLSGTPFEPLVMLIEPIIITPEFVEQHFSFGPLSVLRRVAGIKHILAAPLRCGDDVVGFMNMASKHNNHFQERDRELYKHVAERAALALRAVFAIEELRSRTSETELQRLLQHTLARARTRHEFTLALANALDGAVPCGVCGLALLHEHPPTWLQKDALGEWVDLAFDVKPDEDLRGSHLALGEEFQTLCAASKLAQRLNAMLGVESLMALPIELPDGTQASLILGERQPYGFTEHDVDMLERLTPTIALAFLTLNAHEELHRLQTASELTTLPSEHFYIAGPQRQSIHSELLPGLIGVSTALNDVASAVRQVAPTQATVLICGETGTGKERIARALHTLSTRSTEPFVTLNCAALPPNLMESELFGHEKGAFTGATERRIGKFEQANGGTLFLDEIGELPLELQAKLLRALQEREIERLGGKGTIVLNVRVVAATNRDLHQEVATGRFRADLYYRLNVFPILVPPLRERREDIPVLAAHFAQKFATQLGKSITVIEESSVQALKRHSWQGNIRELENIIERAVILANTSTLRVPSLFPTEASIGAASELDIPSASQAQVRPLQSHDDAERAHILAVLRETNWRVSGEHGAAQILKMKPTTLEYRMKKLGIQRGVVPR
jgi:transcriptional regulator with GAF, ATPase, and Fis domain